MLAFRIFDNYIKGIEKKFYSGKQKMITVKKDYIVTSDGELTIRNLPFKKGKNLIIIIQENNDAKIVKKWRENYLKKIFSVSTWSEEDIIEIEKARQEINTWQIPE